MNKVVFVPAYFVPVGENKKVKIPTGEKKKGILGGVKDVTRKETKWQQTGWSDCNIDGQRLADDLARSVETLNQEGYEVVSVTPIISGSYNWEHKLKSGGHCANGYGGYGYGYGFSYTQSLIVVSARAKFR